MDHRTRITLGAAGGIFYSACAFAAIIHLTPNDNWFSVLSSSSLAPGDEVILAGGVYTDSRRMSMGHRGTAEAPIIIRAADGATPIITRPNARQNVINIEGAQYLTLQGLEVTGGSAGIRIKAKNGYDAKFITLNGNHIHHLGAGAVTANNNGNRYEGLRFVRNEINDTSAEGEGFYLGCNNNACQFFDGVVEQNYIHDLNGPGVSQGDGIEIKDGSYNNIVRDNVIHDTHYPGIIVYGPAGNGGRNTIERNVIWNSGDHAIQAAADAVIRNNVIFSSAGDGIHSQNHQSAIPGNLTIQNNTIRTSGSGIRVNDPAGGVLSGPIEITNNAIYPAGGNHALRLTNKPGFTIAGNVGTGPTIMPAGQPAGAWSATGNLNGDFVNFIGFDAFPKPGSALHGTADGAFTVTDDFNRTARNGTLDVGAYVYDAAGNPGWQVTTGLKEFPSLLGDMDGDGDVDFDDIGAFVLGIHDSVAYENQYGLPPATSGDLDGDGDFDFDDIPGFVNLLGGGTSHAAAVPEPSGLALTWMTAMAAALTATRHRRAVGERPRAPWLVGPAVDLQRQRSLPGKPIMAQGSPGKPTRHVSE